MTDKRRPISFSESDIYIQRSSQPLLDLSESINQFTLPPSPPVSVQPLEPLQTQPPFWLDTAHRWAIRFTMHIVLISLFETLFFWLFVSRTEDQALITLVNGYISNTLQQCSNFTSNQSIAVDDIIHELINQTSINDAGVSAAQGRATINTALLQTSWIYFGVLLMSLSGLTGAAKLRKLQINWLYIIAENLSLVTILALYELMFFQTIVFRYQAISPPELDAMVVSEILNAC
jgi:hypothetical protein